MEKENSAASRVLQIALTYAWMISTLFLGSGRIDWLCGWICVALWVVSLTAVGLLTKRCNPQLMKERAKWRHKDTKRFDKIFLAAYMPFAFAPPAGAAKEGDPALACHAPKCAKGTRCDVSYTYGDSYRRCRL